MNNPVKCLVLATLIVCLGASVAQCGFLVYAGNLPPYHFIGEDQQVQGSSIDILGEVMRRSNISFDSNTVRNATWARVLKETELKAGRMLIGVARTAQREKQFKWIGPFCTLKLGLIARKDHHIRIHDPKDISAFTIGVINKSAPASVLHDECSVAEACVVALSDNDQQFKMLQAGRVDLITHVDTVAPFFMAQLGYNPQEFEMVYVLRQLDLYFAVNVETEDAVVARMQKSLDDMKVKSATEPSVVERILHQYGVPQSLDIVKQ